MVHTVRYVSTSDEFLMETDGHDARSSAFTVARVVAFSQRGWRCDEGKLHSSPPAIHHPRLHQTFIEISHGKQSANGLRPRSPKKIKSEKKSRTKTRAVAKGKSKPSAKQDRPLHHIPGNANPARISPTSSHTMAAVATRHSNNNSPHLSGKSMTSSPRSTRNSHQPSGTSPSLAPGDPLAPVIIHPPSLHSILPSPPMRLAVAIALRHSISHLTAPSARRSAPLISMRAVQSLC